MWAAACPDGPSAMFRVRNVHTVAELKLSARRCAGVRNLLSFDRAFEATAERRMLKALLINAFSVPRGAAQRVVAASSAESDGVGDAAAEHVQRVQLVERVKHTLSFAWVDSRVWLRVYRICKNVTGTLDLEEIGPRLVLEPIRIIASCFSGAILHSSQPAAPRTAQGKEDRLYESEAED